MERTKSPLTIQEWQEVRKTVIELLNNRYADAGMIRNNKQRLKNIDKEIQKLQGKKVCNKQDSGKLL